METLMTLIAITLVILFQIIMEPFMMNLEQDTVEMVRMIQMKSPEIVHLIAHQV